MNNNFLKEGGGTRGFASLLMLQKLMESIAKLEQSDVIPPGISGIDWEPHESSFGPNPPVTLQNRRQTTHTSIQEPYGDPVERSGSGFLSTRRNGNGIDANVRRERTYNELQTHTGKYLPCHYFDYVGGTSTGG